MPEEIRHIAKIEGDQPEERETAFHDWLRVAPQVYGGTLQAAINHQRAAPADPTPQGWRPLGPRNVGGAVRCIAQDPRGDGAIFYAGSAQGGLWKTENDGYTWRSIGEPDLLAPVGCVALAPSNPDVVYVGTGDPNYRGGIGGRGLYRSTNGGDSFTRIVAAPGGGPVPPGSAHQYARIVVDPLVPDRFWVAAPNGLWRFDPGGAVQPEGLGTLPLASVSDVALARDPTNADRYILLAGFTGRAIFRGVYTRSTNSTAWAQVAGGPTPGAGAYDRVLVAFSGTGVGVPVPWAYAVLNDRGIAGAAAIDHPTGVYRSTDFGLNWGAAPVGGQPQVPNPGDPNGQGWFSMALAVDPSNPRRVLVGYIDLHMSIDGGATWNTILDWRLYDNGDRAQHADQHNLLFDARNPRRLWVVNDGGVSEAPDVRTNVPPPATGFGFFPPPPVAAPAWRKRSYGISGAQFTDLTAHPVFPYIQGGGMQDNGTFLSVGGPTWYRLFGADGGQMAFDPGNARRYWVSWQGAGGPEGTESVTLVPAGAPPHPQNAAVLPDVAPPGNAMVPNAAWPLTLSFPANPPLWIGVINNDTSVSSRLLIGRQAGAFITGDAATVAQLNLPGLAGDPSAATIVPTAGREMWIGTTTGQLFHFAGVPPTPPPPPAPAPPQPAWNAVSPAAAAGNPISSIAVHPANPAIVAVSTMGAGVVVLSHNRGVDPSPAPATVAWRNIRGAGQSLPPGPIIALAFHPTDPTVLFAGTLAGVYVARDLPAPDGTNSPAATDVHWSPWSQGLPPVQVNDLFVAPVTNTIRAATYGRGVYEATIDNAATPAAFRVPPVLLSIRSHVAEDGHTYPAANLIPDDPRRPPAPPATNLGHTDAFDIRVDAPSSFLRSEAFRFGDLIDGAEFDEVLVPDQPVMGDTNHVYVQVHNRGSTGADNVDVHLYFADAGAAPGAAPDITAGLGFPADPAAGSPWQRVGPPETIGSIEPGEPIVARFTWTPPMAIPATVALLAVCTCGQDTLAAIPAGPVVPFVRGERRAALRVTAVVHDAVMIRDGVDDDGGLGSVAWGGRSPDIMVVPRGDPAPDVDRLGDPRLGDRVGAGDFDVHVRVHNRIQTPIEVDVQLWQVPTGNPAPGSGWTQIDVDQHVAAVPAGGRGLATFAWNGVADPDPGGTTGKGFALMALARVVDAGGTVLEPYPDRADVTDFETFWQFVTRFPLASNAALRAIPFVP